MSSKYFITLTRDMRDAGFSAVHLCSQSFVLTVEENQGAKHVLHSKTKLLGAAGT